MNSTPLTNARVALIYSPGQLQADYAAGLIRGIERGLFELGARVATLNCALYKRSVVEYPHEIGPRGKFPDDFPLTKGIVEFLESTWPEQRFDLCFILIHDAYLTDALKTTLRERCSRIVNYPLNLLDQPTRFSEAIEFCDATFSAEEEAVGLLQGRFHSKVVYLPMAADPFIFRRIGSPDKPRLLFVGSLYSDRQWVLEECFKAMDVSVFGQNYTVSAITKGIGRELLGYGRWTSPVGALKMVGRALLRDRRIVSDEEYVRLASEHGISLGLSSVRHEESKKLLHKVRLRDYEAPMCGLCHLARRLPELERAFSEGKEMIFYDDEGEVPEILKRIARGDIDWRGIGVAARRRAAEDHTWTVRLRHALVAGDLV